MDPAFVIDQREPLNSSLEHDPLGVFRGNVGPGGLQLRHGRHEILYRLVILRAVPGNIPAGQDTCQNGTARGSFNQDAVDLVTPGKNARLADG